MNTTKQRKHEESGCTDYLQHNADSCPHMNTKQQTIAKNVQELKTDCEARKLTPYVDWQTWASCLSQSRIDAIARKTGFRIGDSFNPDRSAQFNNAVNEARAKKLGLKP